MSSNGKDETPVVSITDGKQLNGPTVCSYPPCTEDIPEQIQEAGLCVGHYEMLAFLQYWFQGQSLNGVSFWDVMDQLTDDQPMLLNARTKKPVFRKSGG